jgi:pSer/pThr/pTyr-binding forkhead associated (FHA) protein
MHVKLKILRGSSAGKVIAIRGPRFYIGRSEECNLRANSDAISRRHCAITVTDTDVRIRDLGSRNGTHVNGKRIEGEHKIQMGDQLRVGPLEFLVTFAEPASKTAATPTASAPRDVASDDEMAGLVSDWLEEADTAARGSRTPDRETREFKLDDTEPLETGPSTNGTQPTDKRANATAKGAKSPPRRPGKGRGKDAPKDTQEAAAQMLRKFFNRG